MLLLAFLQQHVVIERYVKLCKRLTDMTNSAHVAVNNYRELVSEWRKQAEQWQSQANESQKQLDAFREQVTQALESSKFATAAAKDCQAQTKRAQDQAGELMKLVERLQAERQALLAQLFALRRGTETK